MPICQGFFGGRAINSPELRGKTSLFSLFNGVRTPLSQTYQVLHQYYQFTTLCVCIYTGSTPALLTASYLRVDCGAFNPPSSSYPTFTVHFFHPQPRFLCSQRPTIFDLVPLTPLPWVTTLAYLTIAHHQSQPILCVASPFLTSPVAPGHALV